MALFRYFDRNGCLTLENLNLKVTPPNDFDDPFEFSPVVKTQDLRASAEKRIDALLATPSFLPKVKARFPHIATLKDMQALAAPGKQKDALIDMMAPELPALDLDFQKEVQDILSRTLGVICFTSEPKNPLMWALYADKHKGMVIEFDPAHRLFNANPEFIKVDYSPNRATYDPGDSQHNMVEALAKRKSPQWTYQKESRLIVELRNTTTANVNGKTVQLLPIEAAAIKAVTLGVRADSALETEVRSALKNPDLKHVTFHRMTMSPDLFEFVPIDLVV